MDKGVKNERKGGVEEDQLLRLMTTYIIRFIPHTGTLLKPCLKRNGIRNLEISVLNPKTKTPEIKVFPKPVQLLAYSYLLL